MTILRTGQMPAQIKLSYLVITMAGLKSAQMKSLRRCKQTAKHRQVDMDKYQSGTMTFHKFVNRFNFSVQALGIIAFVFSLWFTCQTAWRALSLSTNTTESTRRPHFSHFICSTVFRAATYVPKKSYRHVFFIILNFFFVWLSAAEVGKLRLFCLLRNWWIRL